MSSRAPTRSLDTSGTGRDRMQRGCSWDARSGPRPLGGLFPERAARLGAPTIVRAASCSVLSSEWRKAKEPRQERGQARARQRIVPTPLGPHPSRASIGNPISVHPFHEGDGEGLVTLGKGGSKTWCLHRRCSADATTDASRGSLSSQGVQPLRCRWTC